MYLKLENHCYIPTMLHMFRIPHQHKFPLTKLPSHPSRPPETWRLRLECGISPGPLTPPSAACTPSVPAERHSHRHGLRTLLLYCSGDNFIYTVLEGSPPHRLSVSTNRNTKADLILSLNTKDFPPPPLEKCVLYPKDRQALPCANSQLPKPCPQFPHKLNKKLVEM